MSFLPKVVLHWEDAFISRSALAQKCTALSCTALGRRICFLVCLGPEMYLPGAASHWEDALVSRSTLDGPELILVLPILLQREDASLHHPGGGEQQAEPYSLNPTT